MFIIKNILINKMIKINGITLFSSNKVNLYKINKKFFMDLL
jgi:hypothetical protein